MSSHQHDPHHPPHQHPAASSALISSPPLDPSQANGHPPPSPSRSPSPAPASRPRGRRWLRWGAPIAALFVIGAGAAAVVPSAGRAVSGYFGSLFSSKRPDLILHTVKPEYLHVSVVERGTLESADNKDIVCRVKAGSKGTYASTVKWVIDDGTIVKKGQLLMELDDSSLQDTYRTQSIEVEKAKGEWTTAEEDCIIQVKTNEAAIATAVAALKVGELDLDKFLGIRADPALDPLGSMAGAGSTLVQRGEFRKNLEDISSQLKLAQSDLEAYRDRASWADRSVRFGYLSPSQAKVEQSKLDSGEDKVSQLQKQKYILQTFMLQRDLTDLRSKVKVAQINLEQAYKTADANLHKTESIRSTKYSIYQQQLDKLHDIEAQIRECRIFAPQAGMVVYFKDSNSRWSNSQEGLIQQGAQVKEGQKMMRIPDLYKMQVNTKVHEAMVSRIRGDKRKSTGFFNALRAGLLLTPNPLDRLVNNSETVLSTLRDEYHDQDYVLESRGQAATVRVDAFPDRVLKAHVRSVAAVASQQDWFSSDVKVYQTLVTIDQPIDGLKPDMSAEVTIQVDPPSEAMLTVPLQAVFGGAEDGAKRKVFVMTPTGAQERDVTLGLFNEKMVEVKQGLVEGDQVVLNPKVILGDKVKTHDETVNTPSGRRGGPGMGKGGKGGGKGGATRGKGGAAAGKGGSGNKGGNNSGGGAKN
jgi:multidrug efflux pump subunit AcrA (membrane-fusion protein)